MSLHRKLVTAFISLCALGLPAAANAQVGFMGHGDDNSDFTSLYDPFCDLNTDWFEPIYCDCPERPLNSGWFFGYQRMYTSVSRPRTGPQQLSWTPPDNSTVLSNFRGSGGDNHGDRAWGNRFDFGWMSEEGTGVWFVARKLDSPSEVLQYRNVDSNGDELERLNGDPTGPSFVTLNGLQMWGIEANRIWRLAPTPRGTIIEPYVGARYARLRDIADRDDIFLNSEDLSSFSTVNIGAGTTGRIRDIRLNFNDRQAEVTTDNDLFGGQLGMRSRWRRGRWSFTNDLRALMFFNSQTREELVINERQEEVFRVTHDNAGDLVSVASLNNTVVEQNTQEQNYSDASTFVYGGEWHLDAAFEITQGFALTVGGEVIWFGDGIGRGRTGTDDSLVLAGMSFGFTFNR